MKRTPATILKSASHCGSGSTGTRAAITMHATKQPQLCLSVNPSRRPIMLELRRSTVDGPDRFASVPSSSWVAGFFETALRGTPHFAQKLESAGVGPLQLSQVTKATGAVVATGPPLPVPDRS